MNRFYTPIAFCSRPTNPWPARSNRGPIVFRRVLKLVAVCLLILSLSVPIASPASATPVSLFGAAVGQNADGRLEVFSAYRDGTIYHNYQRPTGGWDGWSSLGKPASIVDAVTVASNQRDGRLEVFVLSIGRIYHAWQLSANGPWSGWAMLKELPDRRSSGMAVAQNKDGRLEVFAENNGNLLHMWQTTAGGTWTDRWASLDHPYMFMLFGAPTVAMNGDGRLEVAIHDRGMENEGAGTWHIWQDGSPDNGWSSWFSFGVTRPTGNSSEALAAHENGRLEIFVLSPTNHFDIVRQVGSLYHKYQGGNGSSADGWSNWQLLGEQNKINTGATLDTALNRNGRLELFGIDTEGRPVHLSQLRKNADEWGGWTAMSNQKFASMISIGKNSDGRLEAFTFTDDGKPFHAWQQSPGCCWTDFVPLGQ